MPSLLSKNVLERALWTGAQVGLGLAVTYLASIPTWWAAPIALLLSAIKTNVVDRMATTSKPSSPTLVRPDQNGGI
jgi:Mg/Co/Ni transporter MgtE